MTKIKPLFIPLKKEYYEAFADGSKTEELRRYGVRWNENNCSIGRAVILSKGYGKDARMSGLIRRFKKLHGTTFRSTDKVAIQTIYETLDIWIACISIDVIK